MEQPADKGDVTKLRADIKQKRDGYVFHLGKELQELKAVVSEHTKTLADMAGWADKINGMTRYTYAICKNDGVKALADKHRTRTTGNPYGLFAGSGQAPRDSEEYESAPAGSRWGDNSAAPRPKGGLGAAGTPF